MKWDCCMYEQDRGPATTRNTKKIMDSFYAIEKNCSNWYADHLSSAASRTDAHLFSPGQLTLIGRFEYFEKSDEQSCFVEFKSVRTWAPEWGKWLKRNPSTVFALFFNIINQNTQVGEFSIQDNVLQLWSLCSEDQNLLHAREKFIMTAYNKNARKNVSEYTETEMFIHWRIWRYGAGN